MGLQRNMKNDVAEYVRNADLETVTQRVIRDQVPTRELLWLHIIRVSVHVCMLVCIRILTSALFRGMDV